MFDLILDGTIFSAVLFFAVSLESCPPVAAYTQAQSDFTSTVSRYLVAALAAFPWITFARFKAGERALNRLGTKFLVSSGVFSGRTYLSEILLSAFVSIALLGWFAARRGTHRLVGRPEKITASNSGTESSHSV